MFGPWFGGPLYGFWVLLRNVFDLNVYVSILLTGCLTLGLVVGFIRFVDWWKERH
jgi:hypothetical protein